MIARGSCEWSWTRREYLHQCEDFGFGKRRALAGLGRVGDIDKVSFLDVSLGLS